MDDAAIAALEAEMDEMRRKQQQQQWDLQAKLGLWSASELESLERPELTKVEPVASSPPPAPLLPARSVFGRRSPLGRDACALLAASLSPA